jgi:putative CocE/NonD family hydrolase
MIGISWGGFNGLQIAARRPAPLKAIVTVGSTDDRYADDLHYMGGAQLSANFTWAQTFFSDLTRPPDPLIVGDAWRDMWLNRLKHQTFLIDRWMAHPDRDAYWRHGSVCEDYSAIECAVFAVGGWADSYTNAVGRLLNGLTSPKLGLIGPWGHDYPHTAVPGPQVGFLQECLRWWDFWLKGIETKIMDEPLLRVFMQEGMSSDPSHATREGHWLGVEAWPPGEASSLEFFLTKEGLSNQPGDPLDIVCRTAETLGAAAGEWCAYGQGADMPADQADDDCLSICFDTPVLDAPLPVFGAAELRLAVVPEGPSAQIVVRLNDVDPSGKSARVTYGVLDLGYRGGFSSKRPLEPGVPIEVVIRLCDTACTIPAGHRMRIAVSSSYWPTVWPLIDGAPVRLVSGKLIVPLLASHDASERRPMFAPAEASMPAKRTVLSIGDLKRTEEHDFIQQSDTICVVVDDGVQRIDAHGLEIGRRCEERYSMIRGKATTARIEANWEMTLARDDWNVRVQSTATAEFENGSLRVNATVKAFDGGELIFSNILQGSRGGQD